MKGFNFTPRRRRKLTTESLLLLSLSFLSFSGTLMQLEFSAMVQIISNYQSYNLDRFTAVQVDHHHHDDEIEILKGYSFTYIDNVCPVLR